MPTVPNAVVREDIASDPYIRYEELINGIASAWIERSRAFDEDPLAHAGADLNSPQARKFTNFVEDVRDPVAHIRYYLNLDSSVSDAEALEAEAKLSDSDFIDYMGLYYADINDTINDYMYQLADSELFEDYWTD